MNTQSNLFREESEAIIASIINKECGSELQQRKLLDGGMFNTTYMVEYGAGEKAILQFAPVNRHLLLGFERNLMEAEIYVYKKCEPLMISSPEILGFNQDLDIIDREYMLTRYIPSIAMNLAELDEKTKASLYVEMGRYLKSFHGITGKTFGYVSRQCEGITFDSWSKALTYEVNDIVDSLIKAGGIIQQEGDKIKAIFENSASLLDEVETPHLLHTDLWEGNVLLSLDTNEILAVIDSDRAIYGDPDFEFSSAWMSNEDLRRGYGLDFFKDMTSERKRRIELYQLYYNLVDAYVGYAEYNNSELYEIRRKEIDSLLKKDFLK